MEAMGKPHPPQKKKGILLKDAFMSSPPGQATRIDGSLVVITEVKIPKDVAVQVGMRTLHHDIRVLILASVYLREEVYIQRIRLSIDEDSVHFVFQIGRVGEALHHQRPILEKRRFVPPKEDDQRILLLIQGHTELPFVRVGVILHEILHLRPIAETQTQVCHPIIRTTLDNVTIQRTPRRLFRIRRTRGKQLQRTYRT